MNKKSASNNQGSVIVAILALVGAVAIVLGAVSTLTTSGYRRALFFARQLQALYAAEAGIEDFLYKRNNGIELTEGKIGEDAENFIFQIENFTFKYPKNPTSTMNFTGISSGVTKTVACTFEEKPSMPAVFRNALASATDLTLGGASSIKSSDENKIHGNVYAHQNINVKGNTHISGYAISAYGTVTIQGNATIEQGTLEGETYYQEIPEITPEMQETWMEEAQSGTNYSNDLIYSGNNNLSFDDTFIDGSLHLTSKTSKTSILLKDDAVIYVKGDLKIDGSTSIQGQGIFVVEGTITVNGNMDHMPDQPASVAFVSLSEETSKISGNGEVTGVFFAPNGSIEITGSQGSQEKTDSPKIFGAVVAKEIKIRGEANITYNPDLLDNPPPLNPSGIFKLTHWREMFS